MIRYSHEVVAFHSYDKADRPLSLSPLVWFFMSGLTWHSSQTRWWAISGLLLTFTVLLSQIATGPKAIDAADLPGEWIYLADPQIVESSGLAESNRAAGHFWTHNDSGHAAQLFAFDEQGIATGGCTLKGVTAIDFEDIASYMQDGIARLLVADVGDNLGRRLFVSLYFLDEPDPQDQSEVTDWLRVDVRYPNGPHDCEAVAVDVAAGTVVLVSKSFLPHASIYEVDLPKRRTGQAALTEPQTARLVGHIPLPLVTAMDRDETTGDTLLVNYFQLFRFPKPGSGRNWWEQTPQATELPKLKQIEAVAVDRRGQVWVTSEGSPAPMARVKEKKFDHE
jgi:hypothetical protein